MMDRIAPTRRPEGPPAGYHIWEKLTFIHWEVDADALQRLLPKRMTLDTFEGRAFVGLVPFTMRGIRPRWLPHLPYFGAFHETNVRTYVHLEGEGPGVWFFSLEAARLAAVVTARAKWKLPYFWAKMSLEEQANQLSYRSQRRRPEPTPAHCNVDTQVGKAIGHAEPGSLEFFLAERYLLYAGTDEALYRGQVYHTPYPLHEAECPLIDANLCQQAGVEIDGPPMSVLYAPRVDVEVFDLERV